MHELPSEMSPPVGNCLGLAPERVEHGEETHLILSSVLSGPDGQMYAQYPFETL